MGFCSVNVRRGLFGSGLGKRVVLQLCFQLSAGAVFHGGTTISSRPVRNISMGIAIASDVDRNCSKAWRVLILQNS